jgi:small-conductance mechanosensitive channel
MPAHAAAAAKPATPPAPIIDKDLDISPADVVAFWKNAGLWLTHHWLQIAIATVIAAIIVVVLMGVRSLGLRICKSDRRAAHWSTVIGRTIAATRLWFMIPLAAHLVAGYAHPPSDVNDTIRFFFVIATALQASLWGRELILGFIEHRAGSTEDSHGSALGIIRLLVSFAFTAIAVILILDNLGVNVTGLVAGLGIGGIAIGLAAQGIFADLFAALAILFDKPFHRGDAIQWGGASGGSGTVEAIGIKSTRLRSPNGELVVISNTNLLGKELHNLARLERRRRAIKFGIIYQTPVEVCEAIPAMIQKIVEGEGKCTLVQIGMTGFGDSSLDYELQFDVHSSVYSEVFNAHSRICIAILKTFNEAGIEFAYPSQLSFTAAPNGKAIMPYPEEPAAEADDSPLPSGERVGRGAVA